MEFKLLYFNCRPIHWACTFARHHILSYLLESGADPSPAGNISVLTPLLYISKFGYLKLAECLLASTISVNQQEGTGRSALHFAAWFGYSKLITLLLQHQAIVDLTDFENRTPLHYAAWFNHKDCCQVLIKSRANIDFQDQGGRTPLHFAVFHNHTEIVQLLLSSGASFHLKSNDGKTAEVIATSNNNNEIIEILQKAQHEYNMKNAKAIGTTSNTNDTDDEALRSRDEIIEDHKKMKQIITQLIELKDYQFKECNTIKETLDQHGFILQIFTQNQADIMRQINGLCEYVHQMLIKLDSATSHNKKDGAKAQPQSSGGITYNQTQPAHRSQYIISSSPTLVTNMSSTPSANPSSAQSQVQYQAPSHQNSIKNPTTTTTNSNSNLNAQINKDVNSSTTSNSKMNHIQPQTNQQPPSNSTNTSQSKIQQTNTSATKIITGSSNKQNIDGSSMSSNSVNMKIDGDANNANKRFFYVNINNSSESSEKMTAKSQPLQQQQKQRKLPLSIPPQHQQIHMIIPNNNQPMCMYCKKNEASFRCKNCHSAICSTCLPFIKQNGCPFCAEKQPQQNDNT